MQLFEHILICYYLTFISQLAGIMAYELKGDGGKHAICFIAGSTGLPRSLTVIINKASKETVMPCT